MGEGGGGREEGEVGGGRGVETPTPLYFAYATNCNIKMVINIFLARKKDSYILVLGCKDIRSSSYCANNHQHCVQHKRYNWYMYTNCKKTCGICQDNKGCFDSSIENNCIQWKKAGYCDHKSKYYASMKLACKKTCGYCGFSNSTVAPKKATLSTNSVTTKVHTTKQAKKTQFPGSFCFFCYKLMKNI